MMEIVKNEIRIKRNQKTNATKKQKNKLDTEVFITKKARKFFKAQNNSTLDKSVYKNKRER